MWLCRGLWKLGCIYNPDQIMWIQFIYTILFFLTIRNSAVVGGVNPVITTREKKKNWRQTGNRESRGGDKGGGERRDERKGNMILAWTPSSSRSLGLGTTCRRAGGKIFGYEIKKSPPLSPVLHVEKHKPGALKYSITLGLMALCKYI